MKIKQRLSYEFSNRKEIDLIFDKDGNSTIKVDRRHYPVRVISEGQVVAELEVDSVVQNAIGMIDNSNYQAGSLKLEFRCHGRVGFGQGLLCAEQRCYVQSCRRISANRIVLILRRLVNPVGAKSKLILSCQRVNKQNF